MIHGDGADLTMAQVCGEQEYGPLTFIPGEDFDPSDPCDVEAVKLATDRDAMSSLDRAREENARLRAWIAELTGAVD